MSQQSGSKPVSECHGSVDVGRRHLDGFTFIANNFGQWAAVQDEPTDELTLLERNLVVRTKANQEAFDVAIKRWSSPNYENPSLFIIHLTQRCNLTCGFCHSSTVGVDAQGKDIEYDNLWHIANFILSSPGKLKNICFQGGEPTLCRDHIETFVSILEADHRSEELEIRLSLTSNGTLIDQEYAEFLSKNKVSVSLSIDGPRTLHDAERRYENGDGSYNDTVATRDFLREHYPHIYAGQIMVITHDSKQKIGNILQELFSSGQREFRFKFVTSLGRGKRYFKERGKLQAEEFVTAYREMISALKRQRLEAGKFFFETYLTTFLGKLFGRVNIGDVDTRNTCGIARSVVDFDIRGQIHACHETNKFARFRLGHASEVYGEVYGGDRAAEARSYTDLSSHSECRTCAYYSYCTPCPAKNFQETGSPEIVPLESSECIKTLKLIDFLMVEIQNDMDFYYSMWREFVAYRSGHAPLT